MQHLQIILSVLFISIGLLSTFYFFQEKKRANLKFLKPLFFLSLFYVLLLVRVFVWGYLSTTLFSNYSISDLRIYSASITLLNWIVFLAMLSSYYYFGYSITEEKINPVFKYFLITTGIILILFQLTGYLGIITSNPIKFVIDLLPILSKIPIYITITFLFYLLFYCRRLQDKDIRQSIISFAAAYAILLSYSILKNYFPSENIFVLMLNSTEHILFSLFPILWYRKYYKNKVSAANSDKNQNELNLDLLCEGAKISEREKEVLGLLLKGKRNKEIQEILFISSSTVKNHLYSIYRKLGVKSQTELMHKYMSINSEPTLQE